MLRSSGIVDDQKASQFLEDRITIQKEAEDSIAWARVKSKIEYDKHHRPIQFNEGEEVFIKLHAGYSLPSTIRAKLSNQRAGPIKIIQKVGKLAYKLMVGKGLAWICEFMF
jgi:signal transduction protein with GAF and PtsI domain